MKITKFTIENFQSILGKYEVPLQEDSSFNLITAHQNGIGKSSIIHAFYFTLCNTTTSNIEEFLNWDSEEMSIHLEFEHNDETYIIDYSYVSGKSDKKLVINEGSSKEEKFTGPASVNKKLKELFDPSVFMTATAIMQGERNFCKVTDGERREHLKKIFNTDFSLEVKQVEKEIKEIEAAYQELDKELLVYKSKEFIDKELEPKNITDEEYEKYKNGIQWYVDKIAENNQSISNSEKIRNEIASLEKEIQNEEQSVASKSTGLVFLRNELLKLKSYVKNETILNDLIRQLGEIKLERIRPFNEKLLEDKKQDYANVVSELTILQKKLKDADNGICPQCNRPLDGYDEHSIEEQKKKIQKEIEEAEALKKTLTEEGIELRKQKDEYEKLIKKQEEAKASKTLLESKIEAEKTRLETEEKTNATLVQNKEKQIADTEKDIDDKKKSIESKKIKLLELKPIDVSQLVDENKVLESTRKGYDDAIREYERINTINETIEKDNKENIQKRINNEAKIQEVQKKLDETDIKKEEYKKMKEILKKEFPSYVISSIIGEIESSMNELIEKIYYKSLDVEIKGTDEAIKVLYGSGSRKVSTVHASGAEEALLSLAYAYALNKMNGFNILFLDEVDSQMNETNSLQLADILLEAKEEFDEVWVISHNNKCKDLYASSGANVITIGKDVA